MNQQNAAMLVQQMLFQDHHPAINHESRRQRQFQAAERQGNHQRGDDVPVFLAGLEAALAMMMRDASIVVSDEEESASLDVDFNDIDDAIDGGNLLIDGATPVHLTEDREEVKKNPPVGDGLASSLLPLLQASAHLSVDGHIEKTKPTPPPPTNNCVESSLVHSSNDQKKHPIGDNNIESFLFLLQEDSFVPISFDENDKEQHPEIGNNSESDRACHDDYDYSLRESLWHSSYAWAADIDPFVLVATASFFTEDQLMDMYLFGDDLFDFLDDPLFRNIGLT